MSRGRVLPFRARLSAVDQLHLQYAQHTTMYLVQRPGPTQFIVKVSQI
jgi:hypothetical protein